MLLPITRNQGVLEQRLIPDLDQRKHEMSLEQLVLENKAVIKDSWGHINGYGAQIKGLPLVKFRTTSALEK